jgi:hypothetical protein
MTPDHINALFEAGGALLLTMNVVQLYRDRRLAGVRLAPVIWFQAWGAFNLWFYWRVGLTSSWFAGIAVFTANTVWVSMAIWFSRNREIQNERQA